jgi:hypothetical protein
LFVGGRKNARQYDVDSLSLSGVTGRPIATDRQLLLSFTASCKQRRCTCECRASVSINISINISIRVTGLIVCYGMFGFGYILPATYLPAQARQLLDDPQIFGWAWPVFGIAAAASTLIVAGVLGKCNRLHVWATSHALMAVGVILPCIWLSMTSIVLAALFVGGNFMVITMLGMQEARARAAPKPDRRSGTHDRQLRVWSIARPRRGGLDEYICRRSRKRTPLRIATRNRLPGGKRHLLMAQG